MELCCQQAAHVYIISRLATGSRGSYGIFYSYIRSTSASYINMALNIKIADLVNVVYKLELCNLYIRVFC